METAPARVALYRQIEQEYLNALVNAGVRFAPPGHSLEECSEIVEQLRLSGAVIRNGGASIVLGRLSKACVACTGDEGSQTFELTLACHRNCFFCFNPNEATFDMLSSRVSDWRDRLNRLYDNGQQMTCIALTGGEPLLYLDEAVDFFAEAHRMWPSAHLRLYTAGDFLDETALSRLSAAGLCEVRISVKLDDPDFARKRALDAVARSRDYIPDVMVEMPVVPGTEEDMRILLRKLDDLGIFGINLLELGFPMNNWQAFEQRGLMVKNPPFFVAYDYLYAGGLPIEGSELLALRLLKFAIEEGLSLGVHYCSLENKHRDQVLTANRGFESTVLDLDEQDFFLKGLVVFGSEVGALRAGLAARGIPFEEDADDGALMFAPHFVSEVDLGGTHPYVSYNIVERRNGGACLRELKLLPWHS